MSTPSTSDNKERPAPPTDSQLEAVRQDILALLKKPDYDDGSAGPVLVRLAWYERVIPRVSCNLMTRD